MLLIHQTEQRQGQDDRLDGRSLTRRDGNVKFVLFMISEHTSETDGHNLGLKAQMQQCSGALLAHGYRHNNISQPS